MRLRVGSLKGTSQKVRLAPVVNRKRFLVFGSPNDELREIMNGFGAIYFNPVLDVLVPRGYLTYFDS